ncbi:hypothetical protein HK104_005023 [Borealophlyctis nickersoniae]|nr:hypothetical protein HK104_005023 [Borealophlyctis nickersoniae]
MKDDQPFRIVANDYIKSYPVLCETGFGSYDYGPSFDLHDVETKTLRLPVQGGSELCLVWVARHGNGLTGAGDKSAVEEVVAAAEVIKFADGEEKENTDETGLLDTTPDGLPHAPFLPTRLFDLRTSKVVLRDSIIQDSHTAHVFATEGYVAISHVWGPCDHIPGSPLGIPWSIPISSPGKLDSITRVASAMGVRWLWIDILCIDQTSEKEKRAEIPNMTAYYRNARCCLAWMDPVDFDETVLVRWAGNEELTVSDATQSLVFIRKVLEDTWFWRVWTTQEAIVPRVLAAVFGASVIVDLGILARIAVKTRSALVQTAKDHSLSRRDIWPAELYQLRGGHLHLADLFHLMNGRTSKYEQDWVYGALGVSRIADLIPIDYSLSKDQIVVAAMETALAHGDYSVLGHCAYESARDGRGILPNPMELGRIKLRGWKDPWMDAKVELGPESVELQLPVVGQVTKVVDIKNGVIETAVFRDWVSFDSK